VCLLPNSIILTVTATIGVRIRVIGVP